MGLKVPEMHSGRHFSLAMALLESLNFFSASCGLFKKIVKEAKIRVKHDEGTFAEA